MNGQHGYAGGGSGYGGAFKQSEFQQGSGSGTPTTGTAEFKGFVVVVPDALLAKCNELHKRYKGLEWSGPAWFKRTDNVVFTLVDFFILNIGSSGFTEWDHRDLAEANVYDKIFLRHGKDQNFFDEHICGNIHTHHGMSHFFSGTDTAAVMEHTPEGELWPSLIVNHGLASCAFGIGYKSPIGQTFLLYNNNVPFDRHFGAPPEDLDAELEFVNSLTSGPSRFQGQNNYYGNRGSSVVVDGSKPWESKRSAKRAQHIDNMIDREVNRSRGGAQRAIILHENDIPDELELNIEEELRHVKDEETLKGYFTKLRDEKLYMKLMTLLRKRGNSLHTGFGVITFDSIANLTSE